MNKKVLLLGHTGKMGIAIKEILANGFSMISKNSSDFDALDFEQVYGLIEQNNPEIVINTVAHLGIDPCEREPDKAFRLNTLLPKFLAKLSNEKQFLMIHFSTNDVFSGEKQDFYNENDNPQPINIYGMTKYMGDCFVQRTAKNYYLIRISILFGKAVKNTQFVEKMLLKIKQDCKVLKIADDVTLSPTYSRDIAEELRRIMQAKLPFGLYHLANQGKATLYDLIEEIVRHLNINVEIERASHKDFPSLAEKSTFTPLKSEKIPSLRPWKEAVKEYCLEIKSDF